jgi:hypothetical protein
VRGVWGDRGEGNVVECVWMRGGEESGPRIPILTPHRHPPTNTHHSTAHSSTCTYLARQIAAAIPGSNSGNVLFALEELRNI